MKLRTERLALALAIASGCASISFAQDRPVVAPQPLNAIDGSACQSPFWGSNCPPPPGERQCRVDQHAESRDRSVRAEIVEDGNPHDLVAVHLVIRVGDRAWRMPRIGERGVGCGTFEMFSASYEVLTLRVADVLHGPRPEVILRARISRGVEEILCTTDVTPPVCVRGDVALPVRYRRPDHVIPGHGIPRFRMGLVPAR